jgi:ABC-type spermidine/putrescine transport system permease subunit II
MNSAVRRVSGSRRNASAIRVIFAGSSPVIVNFDGSAFEGVASRFGRAGDPDVHAAFWRSVNVAALAAPIAVFIGFGAAYTDYRSKFFGKALYLTLGLLPPLVPVLILGVAMLFFFARVGLFGGLYSIVISHVVLCTPFAFTVVRLRLTQVNPALEQAAWNLGAGPWRTVALVIVPLCLSLYRRSIRILWCACRRN